MSPASPTATRSQNEIGVIDRAIREVVARLDISRPILAATPMPGANEVVVVEQIGRVSVWDVETATEIGVLFTGPAELRGTPAVSADGSLVWVGLGEFIYSFPLDPERWVELACARRSRALTDDEWSSLIQGDFEQRELCP